MSVVSNGNNHLVASGGIAAPTTSQNIAMPMVAMGMTARISHSAMPIMYAGAANNASRITLHTR